MSLTPVKEWRFLRSIVIIIITIIIIIKKLRISSWYSFSDTDKQN